MILVPPSQDLGTHLELQQLPSLPKRPRGTWPLLQPRGRKKAVTKLQVTAVLVLRTGFQPRHSATQNPVGQGGRPPPRRGGSNPSNAFWVGCVAPNCGCPLQTASYHTHTLPPLRDASPWQVHLEGAKPSPPVTIKDLPQPVPPLHTPLEL